MALVDGLSLSFLPADAVGGMPEPWWDEVLGVAVYGEHSAPKWPAVVPVANIAMPSADGRGVCEVWRTRGPLADGQFGPIRYRRNDSMIFGCLQLTEVDHAPEVGLEPISALQHVTRSAYEQLFRLLDELRYPGLIRVWNYLPRINVEAGGSERYWQFNAGRQDAFIGCGRTTAGNVPAACALGSVSGPLSVYFLALREVSEAIENPRQMSAYRYPERYGPRSPTFARASLSRPGASPLFFVSGTASIVGHETLHRGDVVAQTVESLRNIEALLDEARRVAPDAHFELQDFAYKVYVRNPADFDAVRRTFEEHIAADVVAVYLQADVCRADLLVEIEASGGHPSERGVVTDRAPEAGIAA